MKKNSLLIGLVTTIALGGAVLAGEPHQEEHPGDLKSIMIDLGEQMARVQAGLWVEDYAAISTAAKAVADHPHVSPEERARVQAALGEDFAAFAQADRRVHDSAVRLAEAADTRSSESTLKEIVEVQSGCVSCHTQFKQRLAR